MDYVNLIPVEEKIEQTKTKVVKFSTILTIILFVSVCAVGGYFYFEASKLRTSINDHEQKIVNLRIEINKLAHIEVNARNLYKKSSTLQNIFDNRFLYSRVLTNLHESTPDGVFVGSISFGTNNSLNITGEAATYNLVQDFSNKLLEKDLFTEISLNSVSLEGNNGGKKFFLVASFDANILYDK